MGDGVQSEYRGKGRGGAGRGSRSLALKFRETGSEPQILLTFFPV